MCQAITPAPTNRPYRPSLTHVNLKVIGQDRSEMFFRMKRTTQLRRLMSSYCERRSLEPNSVVFYFDGNPVEAQRTPRELQMEDGDEMEAFLRT